VFGVVVLHKSAQIDDERRRGVDSEAGCAGVKSGRTVAGNRAQASTVDR
jgi:hypothetical protein